MQLGSNNLLQEMQALNEQLATNNAVDGLNTNEIMPAITQQVNNTAGSDFGELLSQAMGSVNSLQSNAGQLAQRLDMGDTSVTLSDTVIAREKASVAFEATVQVRNKLVEAYKEIMSMPV